MPEHKLLELNKITEERIGSLTEEVEMATNVKLNMLYMADKRDEIGFLQWIMSAIHSILNREHNDLQHQTGVTKRRLEMMQTIEFKITLQERLEELNLKLKDRNNLRESDILINGIDMIESVLSHLLGLKYGDQVRAIEIAEANHNYQQAKRIRKQLIQFQDLESEISAQCSFTRLRSIS